jgi:MFS family permease
MPQALASSVLQIVTPNRMRGIAASLYGVIINLTGLAAAPTIVALLTDRVFKNEQRVGDSLAITSGVAATLSALLLWRSLKAYRRFLDEGLGAQ